MRLPGQRVYVCGRLRGITARRLHHLANGTLLCLIRRPASADAIVLAHNSVGIAVSDAGETSPPFRYAADAQFISERQFRSLLPSPPRRPPAIAATRRSRSPTFPASGRRKSARCPSTTFYRPRTTDFLTATSSPPAQSQK